MVRVTIGEGKHRQIRRLAGRSKLRVRLLHRVSIGPMSLESPSRPALAPRQCRHLHLHEVRALYAYCLPRNPAPVLTLQLVTELLSAWIDGAMHPRPLERIATFLVR